jgi:hypothetical protein
VQWAIIKKRRGGWVVVGVVEVAVEMVAVVEVGWGDGGLGLNQLAFYPRRLSSRFRFISLENIIIQCILLELSRRRKEKVPEIRISVHGSFSS